MKIDRSGSLLQSSGSDIKVSGKEQDKCHHLLRMNGRHKHGSFIHNLNIFFFKSKLR